MIFCVFSIDFLYFFVVCENDKWTRKLYFYDHLIGFSYFFLLLYVLKGKWRIMGKFFSCWYSWVFRSYFIFWQSFSFYYSVCWFFWMEFWTIYKYFFCSLRNFRLFVALNGGKCRFFVGVVFKDDSMGFNGLIAPLGHP